MADEKNVQNGAPDVREARIDEIETDAQRASVGKIGRLPHAIREQINRRLRDGEPASVILPWLNAMPEVREVLAARFGGAAITDWNLTAWRNGGYQRWLEKRELFEDARGTAEEAEEWSAATGSGVAQGTARMTVVKIFRLLQGMSPDQCTMADLVKLSYAITALQKAEQNNEWLAHDEARVQLSGEQLDLRRDIYQRDVVTFVFKAMDDAVARRIHGSAYDAEEKFELMGHCLFDTSWKPRKVGNEKGERIAARSENVALPSEIFENHEDFVI